MITCDEEREQLKAIVRILTTLFIILGVPHTFAECPVKSIQELHDLQYKKTPSAELLKQCQELGVDKEKCHINGLKQEYNKAVASHTILTGLSKLKESFENSLAKIAKTRSEGFKQINKSLHKVVTEGNTIKAVSKLILFNPQNTNNDYSQHPLASWINARPQADFTYYLNEIGTENCKRKFPNEIGKENEKSFCDYINSESPKLASETEDDVEKRNQMINKLAYHLQKYNKNLIIHHNQYPDKNSKENRDWKLIQNVAQELSELTKQEEFQAIEKMHLNFSNNFSENGSLSSKQQSDLEGLMQKVNGLYTKSTEQKVDKNLGDNPYKPFEKTALLKERLAELKSTYQQFKMVAQHTDEKLLFSSPFLQVKGADGKLEQIENKFRLSSLDNKNLQSQIPLSEEKMKLATDFDLKFNNATLSVAQTLANQKYLEGSPADPKDLIGHALTQMNSVLCAEKTGCQCTQTPYQMAQCLGKVDMKQLSSSTDRIDELKNLLEDAQSEVNFTNLEILKNALIDRYSCIEKKYDKPNYLSGADCNAYKALMTPISTNLVKLKNHVEKVLIDQSEKYSAKTAYIVQACESIKGVEFSKDAADSINKLCREHFLSKKQKEKDNKFFSTVSVLPDGTYVPKPSTYGAFAEGFGQGLFPGAFEYYAAKTPGQTALQGIQYQRELFEYDAYINQNNPQYYRYMGRDGKPIMLRSPGYSEPYAGLNGMMANYQRNYALDTGFYMRQQLRQRNDYLNSIGAFDQAYNYQAMVTSGYQF